MTERDDFKFKVGPAPKPANEQRTDRKDEREHVSDTTAPTGKPLLVSSLLEFSVGTGEPWLDDQRIAACYMTRHAGDRTLEPLEGPDDIDRAEQKCDDVVGATEIEVHHGVSGPVKRKPTVSFKRVISLDLFQSQTVAL
jgi:hypothetical protein